MKLFVCSSALALAVAVSAAAQPPGCVAAPGYPPIAGPMSPHLFVGARYSFYQPSFYSSSYYQPSYTNPTFDNPHYPQPGPYWYTPAKAFSPGYYSYYYTPGYFRY